MKSIIALFVFQLIVLSGLKAQTSELSPVSIDIVKKFDNKMSVKVYYTDNLPEPYNSNKAYLKEILDDYKNHSDGKFEYELINPTSAELESDAIEYGIQPVQVQVSNNNNAEAVKAYMGMVFIYSGKKESIPFIGKTTNLEYKISNLISKLSQKQIKKVGLLGGVSSLPGVDKIEKLSQGLSKYYDFVSVDMSNNNSIPNDISVLIVFSPQFPQQTSGNETQPKMPENLRFAIDQYIMNGGNVIFLLGKIHVTTSKQVQSAQSVNVGIEDLIENYGAKVLNDILIDKECAYVSVPVQQGTNTYYSQKPFPYYIKISNINNSLPAFSESAFVYLSFTNSISTTAAESKGISVLPFLTTSPKTGEFNDIAIIQPIDKMLPDTSFKFSNLQVGVILSGKFKSFYKGKNGQTIKEESPETKIIVISNNSFITDEFKGPDENFSFFSNMVDYITDDIGLNEIKR